MPILRFALYPAFDVATVEFTGTAAPFRSTDYQPELIYVLPVAKRFGTLPGGWRIRMLQAGIAHQSNGQERTFIA